MIKLQIQSDTKDGVIDIVSNRNFFEIKRLEIGLYKKTSKLKNMKIEYNVTSKVFQKEFRRRYEKGDQEYIEWAEELKIRGENNGRSEKTKRKEYVAY